MSTFAIAGSSVVGSGDTLSWFWADARCPPLGAGGSFFEAHWQRTRVWLRPNRRLPEAMTPTTRMHVLRRSREIVSDVLTEQEKMDFQIISQLDEVIAGIAQRIEEEAKQVALANVRRVEGSGG